MNGGAAGGGGGSGDGDESAAVAAAAAAAATRRRFVPVRLLLGSVDCFAALFVFGSDLLGI